MTKILASDQNFCRPKLMPTFFLPTKIKSDFLFCRLKLRSTFFVPSKIRANFLLADLSYHFHFFRVPERVIKVITNARLSQKVPSQHSQNNTEVVLIDNLTGKRELCFDFIHLCLLLKKVFCLNGICFPCFLDIQFLSCYVLGEKKSAEILVGRK